MRKVLVAAAVIAAVLAGTTQGYSQRWSLGANMGLSLLDRSPGFHITPVAELLFNRNMAAGTEFSVNTQYGGPLLWYQYFKYYFGNNGSKLKPYANAGLVLTFNIPNAPCFGFLLGGGVNIPIANRLYLTPDVLVGPVFNVGGGAYNFVLYGNYYGTGVYSATSYAFPTATVWVVSIRGGFRYEL